MAGTGKQEKDELEAVESIRKLLRAGVELGVAEAVRRFAAFAPAPGEKSRRAGASTILGSAAVVELIQFIRNDPGSVFHLAKEVWSRGGPKHKSSAAEAIGRGLGYFVPHRAIDAARELASMARSGREADLVGREAIEPVLERSPAMLERVKKFLDENERLLRQAAIAGLVAYVGRKRKYAALAAEVLLLVAEEHEKEISQAVKWGMKRLMEVDPKATALAVTAWVRANPSADRVKAAAAYMTEKAGDVRLAVERGVVSTLARFNGNGTRPSAAPRAPRRTRPTKARKSRRTQ